MPMYLLLFILIFFVLSFLAVLYFNSRRSKETLTQPVGVPEQDLDSRHLETLFNTLFDSVCIIDRDFRIVKANKSYASVVGGKAQSLIAKHCWSTFWQGKGVCTSCPLQQIFTTGKPVAEIQFRKRKKGDLKYYSLSAYPVFDPCGTVVQIIEYIRDITTEKRMVEQLIRSEKLAGIGVMTAGIAHEINNPLSGISGTASNMLKMPEKYGLNERGISRIKMIIENSGRATAIMRDLLHLSHKHESTRVFSNLNELIKRIVNAVHLPGASNIEKVCYLDDTLTPVNCDSGKIEQVIINILKNAIQSIQDKERQCIGEGRLFKGQITVTTQRCNEDVIITIADNGKGVPKEIGQKVFDPFFTTRPPGQGTGLGLSITHRIVEEHGGKLFFESGDEETIFSVILPQNADLYLSNKDVEC